MGEPTGQIQVPADFAAWAKALPENARKRLSILELRQIWEPIARLERELEQATNGGDSLVDGMVCIGTGRLQKLIAAEAELEQARRTVTDVMTALESHGVELCDDTSKCPTYYDVCNCQYENPGDAIRKLNRLVKESKSRLALVKQHRPHAPGCPALVCQAETLWANGVVFRCGETKADHDLVLDPQDGCASDRHDFQPGKCCGIEGGCWGGGE